MRLEVSEGWRSALPGAAAGWLVMRDMANPSRSPPPKERLGEMEAGIRARFAGVEPSKLGAVPKRYLTLAGRERILKPGDMLDGEGVISSVLYGPDRRTRLTLRSRRAAFAVCAPAGIGVGAVRRHLEGIAANVRLVAPAAATMALDVHEAGGR